MPRHEPTVLLIGNGASGHVGGFLARALADLGRRFEFIDEATSFAPPARHLARRAVDRLTRRPGEIRRFNDRVAARARALQPDVVIVVQGYHLHAETLRRLRAETRATLVCYSTDNPLVPGRLRRHVLESVPEYDIYASPRRSNLAALAARGCRMPVHVRFAYEPTVHFREPSDTGFNSDIVFIGGWDHERLRWLSPLSESGDIDLRVYGRGWSRTRLAAHAGGEIFSRDFRVAMTGAKVAPCLVRGSNGDGHVMRSFEIPACGAFMIAERTDEHLELFDEDVHAAYCSTPEELRDKSRYYLAKPAERARIAKAAHQLVIQRGDTYRDRLQQLLTLAEGRGVAVARRAAMPAFVINLKRSTDRRRAMADQFTRLGLPPTFIEAVDGSPALTAPAPLAASELGCLLSHCSVWERMVRESIPAAAIFEDDCRLDARLPDLLNTIERNRQHWDLVLLGHHSRRHGIAAGSATCYRGIRLDGRYRLSQVAEFAMGAYAYVLSLDGARKLLAYAHPHRMPADWVTGYAPAAGARLWAVTPPCAWPDPELAASTTMTDRWANTATRPGGRAPAVLLRVRDTAGLALLYARRLGLRPGSYVKHV